jgi:bifunctional DNA-binding transcriptional regulator/antitoxin component of YhaV-PrlF toxin-antitoxin module
MREMREDSVATIEIEVRLNGNNELTLPDEVVKRLKLEPGNRLIIAMDDDGPDRAQIRALLRSYAGLLNGMFGTDEEALEYVRAERASWEA